MERAIVYTSNAGHTKQYALLLGQRTGLPVYSLSEACGALAGGTGIIYLGWLMAGSVKGFSRAKRNFSVKAVCAVGLTAGNSQLKDIISKNRVPDGVPVFCLQGGFDAGRLHDIYRIMMGTLRVFALKKLENKQNRTKDEDEWLEMMKNGADYVSSGNLDEVTAWYRKRRDAE